jgi:hypothetical protein
MKAILCGTIRVSNRRKKILKKRVGGGLQPSSPQCPASDDSTAREEGGAGKGAGKYWMFGNEDAAHTL